MMLKQMGMACNYFEVATSQAIEQIGFVKNFRIIATNHSMLSTSTKGYLKAFTNYFGIGSARLKLRQPVLF